MQIPHDAMVLVADGAKMLFFRNEGDARDLNLQVIEHEVDDNPRHSDQATDNAGQGAGSSADGAVTRSGGGQTWRRGTMSEVDFHQQQEDRFAAQVADMLNRQALAGTYEHLVVVAPPKTLGELRKHYHKETQHRLAGELAKDLTGHPVGDIEAALAGAEG